ENARAPYVLLGRAAAVGERTAGDVIGGIPVVEAVGEDLIHHAVLHPVRRLEVRNDEEVARGGLARGDARGVEPGGGRAVVDLEAVVFLRAARGDGARPIVECARRIVDTHTIDTQWKELSAVS